MYVCQSQSLCLSPSLCPSSDCARRPSQSYLCGWRLFRFLDCSFSQIYFSSFSCANTSRISSHPYATSLLLLCSTDVFITYVTSWVELRRDNSARAGLRVGGHAVAARFVVSSFSFAIYQYYYSLHFSAAIKHDAQRTPEDIRVPRWYRIHTTWTWSHNAHLQFHWRPLFPRPTTLTPTPRRAFRKPNHKVSRRRRTRWHEQFYCTDIWTLTSFSILVFRFRCTHSPLIAILQYSSSFDEFNHRGFSGLFYFCLFSLDLKPIWLLCFMRFIMYFFFNVSSLLLHGFMDLWCLHYDYSVSIYL